MRVLAHVSFAASVALVRDLDGDGRDEFLRARPDREEVWIVRGAAALGALDAFGRRGKHDWTPMSVLLSPKPTSPAPRRSRRARERREALHSPM